MHFQLSKEMMPCPASAHLILIILATMVHVGWASFSTINTRWSAGSAADLEYNGDACVVSQISGMATYTNVTWPHQQVPQRP